MGRCRYMRLWSHSKRGEMQLFSQPGCRTPSCTRPSSAMRPISACGLWDRSAEAALPRPVPWRRQRRRWWRWWRWRRRRWHYEQYRHGHYRRWKRRCSERIGCHANCSTGCGCSYGGNSRLVKDVGVYDCQIGVRRNARAIANAKKSRHSGAPGPSQ